MPFVFFRRAVHDLPDWVHSLKFVLHESLKSWIDHRADSKGAALAFYTLFSMAPILVLVIAVGGYFFGAEAAQHEVVAQVRRMVGPNGVLAIKALLSSARNPKSGLVATAFASVVFLAGATSVFVELKASLDEIWGIDKQHQSTFHMLLRTRLLSFCLVLALACLLLASLIVSAALTMLSHYADGFLGNATAVLATISSVASFCLIAALFAVIYKMLPDASLSWRDVWIGAAFTTVLFGLGKFAIGWYLGSSGVASSFGAAGSLIALLVWVYYSAQIFYLGAEFTRHYALRFGSQQQEKLREEGMGLHLRSPKT